MVSVFIMATMLEEQRSVVLFYRQKDSTQKISIKICILFTVGRIYVVKPFSLRGKCFANDEEVETEVTEVTETTVKILLRRGFRRTGKGWDKCIYVVEDMSINMFFFSFE
jgi:hypothetical protein